MHLKKYILILLPGFLLLDLYSQQSEKDKPLKNNFYETRDELNKYFSANPEKKEERDGDYQKFMRWLAFMEPRVFPSGKFEQGAVLNEWVNSKNNSANHKVSISGNWAFMGPAIVPSGSYYPGIGRVNCLRFDPFDNAVLWVGTPNGGLWRSPDAGSTWTTNTDQLSNISIADIAINPAHPDTMYIATGDGYGYYGGTTDGFWGGTYSAGILRSVDGGNSWQTTGLSYSQDEQMVVQRLVISPSSPSILLAATTSGIKRSTDAGVTWTHVRAGHFFDIEFNASDPNIVYAGGATGIFRSANMGLNWSFISSTCTGGSGRVSLAVTAANSNIVYALCADKYVYRSTDGGLSFTQRGNADNEASFYGYYDLVLAVSPINSQVVFVGGLSPAVSLDGGNTWTVKDYTIHPDNHDLQFVPGTNSIYSCNDGGVYQSDDLGSNWNNYSDGLAVSQLYRLSCSATDPNMVYMGAQDNSTFSLKNGFWESKIGGDGMECIIDHSDENIVYGSYQNGAIQKSYDGGQNFSDASPWGLSGTGNWITPYVMDPADNNILYAGYSEVYQTTDGGNSWNAISNNLTGGNNLTCLALAASDPLTIYASYDNHIYRTDDGGNNWTEISTGLPWQYITYIAVSSTDANDIWITYSGYTQGEKVYFSDNGGASWTNVSGTLPNVPVNCIVYENGSNDGVYVGTDFGVYYRDNSQTDWISFSSGLPNVIVYEMEIQYGVGKLRAATYGRGLWESDLYSPLFVNDNTIQKADVLVFPNPAVDEANVFIKSAQFTKCKVEVLNVLGEIVYGSDQVSTNVSFRIDLAGLTNGTYIIKAFVGENVSSQLFAKTGK